MELRCKLCSSFLLINCLNRGTCRDCLQFVRTVFDTILSLHESTTRQDCRLIASKIVQSYPDTFLDKTLDGEQLGCGYSSLLDQLKTRIENLHRNTPTTRLRKRSSTHDGDVNTVRNVQDSYGCGQWQPELPEEEGDETLEEKRLEI